MFSYVLVSFKQVLLHQSCTCSTLSFRHADVSMFDSLLSRESLQRLTTLKSHLFRLDRYDSYSTSGIFYSNLSRLLYDEPVRYARLLYYPYLALHIYSTVYITCIKNLRLFTKAFTCMFIFRKCCCVL